MDPDLQQVEQRNLQQPGLEEDDEGDDDGDDGDDDGDDEDDDDDDDGDLIMRIESSASGAVEPTIPTQVLKMIIVTMMTIVTICKLLIFLNQFLSKVDGGRLQAVQGWSTSQPRSPLGA